MQSKRENLEIILTEEQIKERICQLAERINSDYKGRDLVIVCVLRGSVYFAVDLTRRLTVPFTMDFISISSYGGTSSEGVVRIVKDLDVNIYEKNVLLLEGIVDTGLTLNYLWKNLSTRNPGDLKIGALLDMPARRIVDIPVDYLGFELPDIFVVGCGLDYKEHYRNLPYIAALKE